MTRNFNEQRRYDGHPSSRNQSSDRHGEERSPRPARPRLNRQTVDRAWETGARRDHADYRTRNNSELPLRNNRGHGRYADHAPAQNGRKSFDNHQNDYQRTEYAPDGYQNPRPRSYGSNARNYNDRRANDRRSYSPRPAATPPGGEFRDNEHFGDRNHQRSQRDQQRGFDRDSRSSRPVDRDSRPSRGYPQRSTQNPRWQSRPEAQNDDRYQGRQDFSRHEGFEGDYERFETSDTSRRPVNRSLQNRPEKQSRERHVTRLPEGHTLKGPGAVQSKDAEFRTEIEHDAEAILPQVDTDVAPVEESESSVSHKSRKRAEGKATYRGKADAKPSTARPRSTGPKPSQRGFKWPTP
jgi:hypothetical protein